MKKTSARKNDIIAGLIEVRQKILGTAMLYPPDQTEVKFLGEWSVKDLLAHLAGWDQTNEAAVRQLLAGERPAFFDEDDADWRTYNAILVEKYGMGTFDEVVDRMRLSHKSLITFLGTIEAEDFKLITPNGRSRPSASSILNGEIKDEYAHFDQLCEHYKKISSG